MYETYDIDQLIPLIDAHFRTTATRAGRVVIGVIGVVAEDTGEA